MEGAVDRAVFLAKTDLPIAIVGARGTGKMYVARVVHEAAGGEAAGMRIIDCREFRNRDAANRHIDSALRECTGGTLVFKYPHLMCSDAQQRLARQLTTRTLLDSKPPRTLPRAKYVALFPDAIERLIRNQQLNERLGSVFAGYPISVPPIRARQRAVLRWADKILRQECEDRGVGLPRFTPEAEEAMLGHGWDGNISEMRQRIVRALESADGGGWISPADLGLYGSPDVRESPVVQPLLDGFGGELSHAGDYRPSARSELEQRLAEAVHHVLDTGGEEPLGTWLEDEIVLAVLARCGGQTARAAKRLRTTSRNVQRWLPGIEARNTQRADNMNWKPVGEVVARWVDNLEVDCSDPVHSAREIILQQLEIQGMAAKLKTRAAILGVSVPTYNKRLRLAAQDGE
nr:sigma 54-interacting transcriptional regulator [Parahaliea mediterranea]